jgi:hypothetical protein
MGPTIVDLAEYLGPVESLGDASILMTPRRVSYDCRFPVRVLCALTDYVSCALALVEYDVLLIYLPVSPDEDVNNTLMKGLGGCTVEYDFHVLASEALSVLYHRETHLLDTDRRFRAVARLLPSFAALPAPQRAARLTTLRSLGVDAPDIQELRRAYYAALVDPVAAVFYAAVEEFPRAFDDHCYWHIATPADLFAGECQIQPFFLK